MSWTARDGAPTNIAGITQTPDGWLWIGSPSGLFRFDGVRFERMEGALAPLSSNVACLGMLADGTLWLAYKYGGVSLMKDGRMRHYHAGEGNLPRGAILAAVQDKDGHLWLGGNGGLRTLAEDGSWRRPEAGFGAPPVVTALLVGRDGTLWVRAKGGAYALVRGGTRLERKVALPGDGNLAERPDGSIWTSDSVAPGLHLIAGTTDVDSGEWFGPGRVSAFLFDHAGNLWQPAYEGATRSRAGASAGVDAKQRTDAAHGLSGMHGLAGFEDRERNIWIGTENGLDRFRDYKLQPLMLPPHAAAARPLASARGGGMWIDGAFLARPGAALRQFAPPTPGAAFTSALQEGPDGTLWSGGIGRLWAFRDGVRTEVALPVLPAGVQGKIFALTADADGVLWASLGPMGLYALRNGQWSTRGVMPGLEQFAPTTVVAGDPGVLWVGSTNDQAALIAHGALRRFSRADGLAVGAVQAVLPMAGGAWVGGENGLAHFDGKRFAGVTGRGGEPFAGITGLVFARDGTLWLNGAAGLAAIAPAELARVTRDPAYRVRFDRLDYRDGLLGSANPLMPMPSAIRSKDGTLWFSTLGATFAFDPATLPRNTLAPPVIVTALKAGGKTYAARDGLRLAPGTSALAVDFTALSLRAPERMGFRYRLEGVDRDWQEADGRRSVQYTNLAPGRYRFRVIASNDDGVWNARGATLAFEIAPSLTQTLWFRLLCITAVLLALWLLHRMRLRRVAHRLSMQMNTRVAERERIARELHDTLLQAIQGVVLKFDAALQGLRPNERRPLEDALDSANRVLAEGRDRVAGLRGAGAGHEGLVRAIADCGTALARERGVGFDVVTEGEPVALDDGTADEVLAIVREAVWNALAHAEPGAVTVTLRQAPDALIVTVADDGRGMPADVARDGTRAGHWGVAGMRERAAKIGAQLALTSRAGAGTVWTLVVPCAHARARARERMVDGAGT